MQRGVLVHRSAQAHLELGQQEETDIVHRPVSLGKRLLEQADG